MSQNVYIVREFCDTECVVFRFQEELFKLTSKTDIFPFKHITYAIKVRKFIFDLIRCSLIQSDLWILIRRRYH